jgi:Cytochrome oxidase complex assembly protein 1
MTLRLPPPPPEKSQRRRPGWLARAGFGTLRLGFLGLLRLVLSVVFRGFKTSGAYKEAMARATSHPEVRRELGSPIQAGWWVSGSLAVSGPQGEARFATPLHGPRGRALLKVQARKVQNRWQFDILEVSVEGSSRPIRLLETDTLVLDAHADLEP